MTGNCSQRLPGQDGQQDQKGQENGRVEDQAVSFFEMS